MSLGSEGLGFFPIPLICIEKSFFCWGLDSIFKHLWPAAVQVVVFSSYTLRGWNKRQKFDYMRVLSHFHELPLNQNQVLSCPSRLLSFAFTGDFHVLLLISHIIMSFPVVNNESKLHQHVLYYSCRSRLSLKIIAIVGPSHCFLNINAVVEH